MSAGLSAFAEASLRTATPLAFAALGEMIGERAGLLNVGLEGMILVGALGAFAAASADGFASGLLAGALAGMLLAAVFGLMAVTVRANQVVAGTALNLLAFGLTGALARSFLVSTPPLTTVLPPLRVPILADVPLVGVFFAQPLTTYLAYAAVLIAWWFLFRTGTGLALRAVGERPQAAHAVGVSPTRMRWLACLTTGALAGLSGAALVTAQTGTFAEGMSAGRGFIAIAIVALGRWSPVGVLAASLLFGATFALQYRAQSVGSTLPYQLFLALPYVLTLLVLVVGAGRSRAPESLGISDPA